MTNEAAERPRFTDEYNTVLQIVTRYKGEWIVASPPMGRMLNELTEALRRAIANERRATVERIRAEIELVKSPEYDAEHGLSWLTLDAILDAEGSELG